MKLVIVLLMILSLNSIEAKSRHKCMSNSCQSCVTDPNCVWCDSRCIDKDFKMSCSNRISDSSMCQERSCCEYKGQRYNIGDTFKDDCNTCTCLEAGGVSCTLKLCYGCETLQCLEGSSCVMGDNGPECKSIESSGCEALQCLEGSSCVMGDNGPECKPFESSGCEALQCLEGSSCVMGDYGPECKPNESQPQSQSQPQQLNCKSDNDCDSGYFCSKNSCDGDFEGTCAECNSETICTTEYDPVCGCDGQTYGNSCEASRSCVNVKCSGECQSNNNNQPQQQESCKSDDDCSSGYFCSKNSCDSDFQGTCIECNKDMICYTLYSPVCGCDENTYSNECDAMRSCVNVKRSGECQSNNNNQPQQQNDNESEQHCQSNDDCKSGHFCEKESCLGSDMGICSECNPQMICNMQQNEPVCGCDDITYPNTCEAAKACVNVKCNGGCESQTQSQPQQTSCKSDTDCDSGYFCSKSSCEDNSGGTCTACNLDMICETLYAPVCGCDDITYSNLCDATRSCVSVKSQGECKGSSESQPQQPESQSQQPESQSQQLSCTNNDDCGSDEYCVKQTCTCDQGTCTKRRLNCTREYDPVCGCDGLTYSNPCVAESSGANVGTHGECTGDMTIPNQ